MRCRWAATQRRWAATTATVSELLLDDLGFNLLLVQFVAESLILYPQILTLLFTSFDLLFQQDAPLNSHIKLGLQILQGRSRMTRLTFIVIICNLNISYLQL
jgi:hypothetical protein